MTGAHAFLYIPLPGPHLYTIPILEPSSIGRGHRWSLSLPSITLPRALPFRDQRLIKDLVSGTVRWKRRLDYIISQLAARSASDLDPEVLQVLRLGIYELTFRDLPAHAIGEHVGLAKSLKLNPGATGLVNAVLRSATRAMEEGKLPDPDSLVGPTISGRELLRGLAISHSHPNWLVARWLKQFGRDQAEALMRANNRVPVHYVRVNPLRGSTAHDLAQAIEALGGRAEVSELLPADFVRVETGLQAILAAVSLLRGPD